MVDMNAELYRCCGFKVEIQGYATTTADGVQGRRVSCELCKHSFFVPGNRSDAKAAIPGHFQIAHHLKGPVEDWHP